MIFANSQTPQRYFGGVHFHGILTRNERVMVDEHPGYLVGKKGPCISAHIIPHYSYEGSSGKARVVRNIRSIASNGLRFSVDYDEQVVGFGGNAFFATPHPFERMYIYDVAICLRYATYLDVVEIGAHIEILRPLLAIVGGMDSLEEFITVASMEGPRSGDLFVGTLEGGEDRDNRENIVIELLDEERPSVFSGRLYSLAPLSFRKKMHVSRTVTWLDERTQSSHQKHGDVGTIIRLRECH